MNSNRERGATGDSSATFNAYMHAASSSVTITMDRTNPKRKIDIGFLKLPENSQLRLHVVRDVALQSGPALNPFNTSAANAVTIDNGYSSVTHALLGKNTIFCGVVCAS